MLLTATWTVTLGGITLLAADDWMDSEPSIVPAGVVRERKYLRGAFSSHIGRRNISHTVSFSRVKNCASDAAAREFLLTHMAELPLALPGADMTLAIAGGDTFILSGAVLTGLGSATTKNHQFLATYTVKGGELSRLATADQEVTEGGDRNVDEAGTGTEITE